MQELNSIMRDFLEIEYNQESLLCLLRAAETTYNNEEQETAKYVANSTKYYLIALQKELKVAINRLDIYSRKRKKKIK